MADRKRNTIAHAVKVLCEGGIVAFPTETVYGLGADARSSDAVKKIYAAKGRPTTNPSIVHVADAAAAKACAASWPAPADKLAAAFWPGPLTLVLPKNEAIVSEATAGRSTVALRVPNHPMALEMLREFGGPVAAPSANRSGRVSPTTADHVREELGDQVDVILDGGPCRVGIESTVLNMTEPRPIIFRLGGISQKSIEQLIGNVGVLDMSAGANEPMASPGMLAVHYSPTTPLIRFEAGQLDPIINWCKKNPTQPAVVIAIGKFSPLSGAMSVVHVYHLMPPTAAKYAQMLYGTLHHADRQNASVIWVQMPPDEPDWAAIRDRLKRASNKP